MQFVADGRQRDADGPRAVITPSGGPRARLPRGRACLAVELRAVRQAVAVVVLVDVGCMIGFPSAPMARPRRHGHIEEVRG